MDSPAWEDFPETKASTELQVKADHKDLTEMLEFLGELVSPPLQDLGPSHEGFTSRLTPKPPSYPCVPPGLPSCGKGSACYT